jgi:RHH-type proline utilization regulon transcriptional repressor/proline dehydrogenase/delta 1-pyrroline-5-carboxylate dehydrogenase
MYDDPRFLAQLHDAVTSLPVGDPTDPASVVPPLIGPPSDRLSRALRTLDPGEEWLVTPRCLDADRHLWSPGVRLGVRPGSWFHQTECFGPVLGVMRARDLDEAIAFQNATPFGLTGGIASLDPSEIASWSARVEVGNAYVNRPITGAVVRRQPFGGWKASAVGPGTKAGGPNYVASLCRWHAEPAGDTTSPIPAAVTPVLDDARASLDRGAYAALERTARDYGRWWSTYFSVEHDPSALEVESNVFRYRPLPRGVLVVVDDSTDPLELARAHLAGAVCGVAVRVCDATRLGDVAEVEAPPDRVRLLARRADEQVWSWAVERRLYVDDHPVLDNGRLELWRWMREQSTTETTHRMGTVLGRAPDRVPVSPDLPE